MHSVANKLLCILSGMLFVPLCAFFVTSSWGTGAIGDYSTGADRFSPDQVLPQKWESCYTIQQSSWGYDRTEGATKFLSTQKLLMQLVSTVSCNG